MADDIGNDDAEDGEEYELSFWLGDVVQLKSGGPPMTVAEIPDASRGFRPDEYYCVWFRGATRESGYFAEHLLQRYTPPEKR